MTTKTKRKPKLTAEQAVTFDRHSETNYNIVFDAAELRGCECEPYRDWFTYARWLAQGQQVQKGEKGIRLTTYGESEEQDPKTGLITTTRRPWKTYVFCRCQVKPREPRA